MYLSAILVFSCFLAKGDSSNSASPETDNLSDESTVEDIESCYQASEFICEIESAVVLAQILEEAAMAYHH